MQLRKFINRYTVIVALLCAGILPQSAAYAAPMLTDTPLFLKTTAESNVFFLMDTSDSMKNEVMTPEDCGGQGGCYIYGGNQYRYIYYHGISSGGANVDITAGISSSDTVPFSEWAVRSYDYNKMYYNPERTYGSWPNEAAAGMPTFTTLADLRSVPVDPTAPTLNRVDLTRDWDFSGGGVTVTTSPMHYYTWTDANANGSPDAGEGTLHTINALSEKLNFAYWFTYHRNRNYSAKFALGKTVSDIPLGTRLRIGYEVLSNSDNLQMTSITSNLAAAGDPGYDNMVTFRTAVYANSPGGSTPLRAAYARSATYFTCDGNADAGRPTPFGDTACALEKDLPNAPAECQQNFLVVMTDGAYNGSFPAGHNDKRDADNDLDTDNTAFDANGPSPLPDLGGPYVSDTDNTLADLAMYYYETDLDTTADIGNGVPIICGVDENAGQHLVTYALSFGIPKTVTAPTSHPQLGLAFNCTTTTVYSPASWLDTFLESSAYKTNDIVHAAYNGRGKFYEATNPEALLEGLQDALQDAASRTGASAGIGVSSTTNSGGTVAYLATFRSVDWFGELSALAINDDGTISTTADWQAHSTSTGYLNDPLLSLADRTIITYNATNDATLGFGRAFKWASLTDTQKDDLRTNSAGGADSDTIALDRLNYIRGEHGCEFKSGTTEYIAAGCTNLSPFRGRNSQRLGDIINSTPVYVGTPVANYPNTSPFPTATPYRAYRNGSDSSAFTTTGINATNRTPVLYVGANDGMLHAFNGDTGTGDEGKEIFSYVPGALYNDTNVAGLHLLTENNAHISYVDLTPTIADAFVDDPRTAATDRKWRTVLVGGLRNGGRGLFALDITDPDYIRTGGDVTTRETRAAQKVMWEFTNADDVDLGYTYSQPVVVPMRVASTGTAITATNVAPDIQWFVVVGNGYNSDNEHSVLFLLKLSGPTGAGNTWTLNTDYYKIDTGVGDASNSNGLSSPAVVDTNGDKIFDRVYAGDLQGRMWAFDVSLSASDTNWAVDYSGYPLYVAANGDDEVQPITVKPTVARNVRVNTATQNEPNIMVMFGTGSYLADGDETNDNVQSFYGVYDDGYGFASGLNRVTPPAEAAGLPAGGLVAQAFIATGDVNVRAMNTTSAYDVNYASADNYDTHTDHHHGWYIDFDSNASPPVTPMGELRERVASKATLVGSTLFFATIVPDTAPCNAGGSGWLMAVDPMDGHPPGINTFDITGDAIIDTDDITTDIENAGSTVTGARSNSMIPQYSFLSRDPTLTGTPPCDSGSAVQVIGAATDASTSSQTTCARGDSGKAGRYSWRQLDF